MQAHELRQEALLAYVDQQGIAPVPVAATQTAEPATAQEVEDAEVETEVVSPDPEVYTRESTAETNVVGNSRMAFEPWEPVPVGDMSVLDDLPKVAAKQKVRAVAVEIVEAEGPVHLDRLAQLIAASFGVQKLHANRAAKITRQVKAAGLVIDKAKFVWPEGVDATAWAEFRPNTSQIERPFLFISPIEIANAMRFLSKRTPGISGADLDPATLRTFGRKRRTKQYAAHLAKARALQ